MCGCDFDGELDGCRNRYPDCPALTDEGQNFGAGFYNDHHFHFGYHIYAAAGNDFVIVIGVFIVISSSFTIVLSNTTMSITHFHIPINSLS